MFCQTCLLEIGWIFLITQDEKNKLSLNDFQNFQTQFHVSSICRGHENVTLTLSWNVIPNAGNLPRISATGSHSFPFPVDYTATRVMQVPLKNCLKFCLLKKIDTKTSFWHTYLHSLFFIIHELVSTHGIVFEFLIICRS